MAKIGSAIKSTTINIIFQVVSRMVTFVMNAFILRFADKDALGIMNVRLLLLYTSVQFISREPFRRSCASINLGNKSVGHSDSNQGAIGKRSQPMKAMVNLIWFNVPLCAIVGIIFSVIWTQFITIPNANDFYGYNLSVILILSSVLIEMMAESVIIYSLSIDNYKVKLRSESVSFMVRCMLVSIGVIYFDTKNILIMFGVSHVVSSIVYVCINYASYYGYQDENIKSLNDFLPGYGYSNGKKCDDHTPSVSANQLSLTLSFLSQTIIKQLLTEGEKFVMTLFDPLSFSDQGLYDMVNNLASLASRFVLAPVEESAFLIFSRIIDRDAKQDGDAKKDGDQDRSVDKISDAKIILSNVTKMMILFGSVMLVFGVNFSRLLLLIYAGRSYVTSTNANIAIAPILLKYQCVYVPIIAVNGIAECFSFASMEKNKLASFNRILVGLSILYLICSYLLCNLLMDYQLASLGFIIANIINMSVRVTYHLFYIAKYFKPTDANNKASSVIKSFLPSSPVIFSSISIFIILNISDSFLCCESLYRTLTHLIIGIILFIIHSLVIYYNEIELVTFMKDQLSDKIKSD